jgi:hypothetical protein
MGNQQPVNGAGQGGMVPGAQGGDAQPGSRQPLPPGSYPGAYLSPQAPQGYPGYGMPSDPSQQQHPQNMERTASDASMTIMDNDQQLQQHMQQQQQMIQQQQQSAVISTENWLDDDSVPTVFRWEHGMLN